MKKMKNKLTISIVLAVFALFAVIAVPSVSAAYPANAIYLDPADSCGLYCENNILVSGLYCKNNTLVEVRINASVTIYGVQTDIYFDPSCVNITDVDFTGSSWPGGWWHYGNYVRLIGVNSSGTPAGTPAGDNLFATVRLHCVNLDYCKSDLGFSGVVVTDEYANLIDITAYNGIFKCKLGDLNDDGNVNCDDVILCMQMVIGSIDPTDEADMNCDGTVDISDCILIYRMMGLGDLNGDGKVNCEDVILCLETNEADLNCDDIVDISDCILIMRMAGLGDLNDDDKVNCEDVILCNMMVLGVIEPTDEADLNCDGTVDISDYILIMRMAGLGDLNGDGKVTCEDAMICLDMAVGLIEPTDEADVNCDGTVDISDCILIWRMAGLGDLNGDGKVTCEDAMICLDMAVGLIDQTDEADMNCDGTVDISDCILIWRMAGLGDLNGDGKVTCEDAMICLDMAVGLIEPTDEADVNCDGTVDISDCILIWRMAGLGDLNGDGKVTCEDAMICLDMAVGLIEPTDEADLNCDGTVDISDCILIWRMAGLGDLNGDGKVTCEDAMICLDMAVGLIEPTDEADLNCDGTVDISDCILIWRMAGLGDLNGDGKVTCEDAMICLDMALNSVYTDEADMNCDGTVDISDCQLIWMMVGLGDLNDDGIVDILDVILCLRQAIGLDTQTPEADMNCDGIVDMSDVVLVMHIAIGLPLDSEISVLPDSFDVTLPPDTNWTEILEIGNGGEIAPLGYRIRVDKPWLDVDPWWGLVEPGNYNLITVSIDTKGLKPGDYSANINISSTDRTDLVNKPGENVPVNLNVVRPEGGLAVAVLPLFSNVIAGDTVDITVKIISTENFDDKLHVYLSTEGLDNPADLDWFNWTEKNVMIPASGEITIPLRAVIRTGEPGIKLFRVIVESTIWRTEGFGTGIFGIT